MSADDQAFLDVLSSLPNDIRRYSTDVADFVDRHVDQIAETLREALASSPWLPEQLRPRPPPPTPIIAVPTSALEKAQNWISRHKILVGFIVLTTGAVAYRSYRNSALWRKSRRAKRARSGGRMEVVVIAGSPALPLTRSLSLDLERKSFIVFVVSNSHEDEIMVQNLSRPDIRPLSIDITDPPSAGNSIENFARYLQAPHAAIPNGKRHHLSLKSVILIPSLNYQTSPIATIPPSSFADLFNTHLLQPILTIQAFLPLLTARLGPADKERPIPKVLVFTPSIISSINPPFHAPEATVCSALSAFTEVLTAELRPLGIPVTHMQLGTFDFAGFTPAANSRLLNPHGLLPAPEDAEALPWPESARHAYGKNFVSQLGSAISAGRIKGMRGSSLRELHNAVFDVIDGSITSGTVRVGLGASVYGFVGRWVPRGLVAWMMGIRRVDELATWQGNNGSSAYGSPRSVGSDAEGEGGGESFVSVPPLEQGSEVNVWKEG
ncbi:D-beta-hydroxybutyrate dehydrogenase, mitochondrial [Madurella mycetomatis]|uniref:D-beta-hydroxybutyrate dehydrogenase, mitochondrial n=1 Tax=Madurella mycetomatis TaxID=100816 RepID=A0A175W356_9PEZI|nr:D-beta-hydroxybutyrate dehydrogenase, mitochondrial [Madurella mycetomatis]